MPRESLGDLGQTQPSWPGIDQTRSAACPENDFPAICMLCFFHLSAARGALHGRRHPPPPQSRPARAAPKSVPKVARCRLTIGNARDSSKSTESGPSWSNFARRWVKLSRQAGHQCRATWVKIAPRSIKTCTTVSNSDPQAKNPRPEVQLQEHATTHHRIPHSCKEPLEEPNRRAQARPRPSHPCPGCARIPAAG